MYLEVLDRPFLFHRQIIDGQLSFPQRVRHLVQNCASTFLALTVQGLCGQFLGDKTSYNQLNEEREVTWCAGHH